jgi:putative ABC transport system ATP-binding protein
VSKETLFALDLEEVRFSYNSSRSVLDIPVLSVPSGERLFLYGPSGSGKTTLLSVIAGILTPKAGKVQVLGTDLATLSGAKRDRFRGSNIGYIFQLFNLIPYLNVYDNIALPCRLHALRRSRLQSQDLQSVVRHIAGNLGIEPFLQENVLNLSVGQQQRVAAARALIGSPELVIADEPTSSLDSDQRERFIELLFNSCREAGSTLIFVSHDRNLMPLFDRCISLAEINQARSF